MSNGSPTAYLLWAILSCIFLAFLFIHLWAYDRFKCLRWDAGRQPGAFKRVMTYSYLATLPMLVIFSVAMTVIKFKEGYIMTPTGYIIPRPFMLWNPRNKSWLLPLYFVLSVGWSLELVTHLEELTFWLFLLHQGPGKREWFYSWEFRTWYLGSMIAVLGMPLTTLITRRQLETCQAYMFVAGASAGTSTTICFLYVLAKFPGFIRHVKAEGAEPDVVVRLTTFYQLNCTRVMFRFLFTIPLLIIGADGVAGQLPIVGHPFALDFLLMTGGIGCFISSAITLLIFFPRSVTHESGYKPKPQSPQGSAKAPDLASPIPDYFNHPQPASSKAVLHHDQYYSNPAGVHMNAFRFPDEPPAGHPLDVLEPQSQPSRRRRDSAESEISPGYETDAESIAMDSQAMSLHFVSSRRITSQTDVSHLVSGERSEDTVWERPQEHIAPIPQRRYSDGPFIYSPPENIIRTIPESPMHLTRSQPRRLRPTSPPPAPSQLHPYVIHFTSPIDLVDLPPTRPLQFV
ncbi:hypothetical protein BDQ12DRAFT_673903 [Crucibulum laeve]|uniref:Uncharacterized protein n=1 Tax=Crucibulum laeve TaxID=68775 RepID=A0A5C3MIH1_9AGAR|nr:hypothetical protein BDQ12DRAFT_673903 [Crucibulum laeve]